MGIPYRVYHTAITVSYSKSRRRTANVRQEYSFFVLFSKAFISVYVLKYDQCNDFIFFFFFLVFDCFLENNDTFILA